MLLFYDFDALFWLVIYFVIALVLAYTVFFGLFRVVCGLDPSRAIRMALTVSLVDLAVILCIVSEQHAYYLAFWNDFSVLPSFLLITVPLALLITAAWASLPKEEAK